MKNNGTTKKEFSCKPLSVIFDAGRRKNIDLTKILEGVPYDLSYLLNRHERIEWRVWCKIIANLRPYFTLADYEQMGKDYEHAKHYIEGYIVAFMFLSSDKIAKIAKGPLLKAFQAILKPMVSCFTLDWESIEKNKFRLSIYLHPGYEQCSEWFYMSKGLWEELGNRVGLKGLTIALSIVSNGGVYVVSWEEGRILSKLKKWVRWMFNIRKAFVELTDSHEELLNNYNRLDEAKRLLQKQTAQLTTAYNITKSIRQSYDIIKTLNAITGALVNDAGVSSARIKIFRDIEGDAFETEACSGIAEFNVNPVKRPILINDETIGELIIFPRIDADVADFDELLNYLLPMINISIHDSLVLRTVTDYKNNLETKVDERTTELKEAQEKLSEIIQLQNHFFANISHEFRTPLTLILGPVKQIIQTTGTETFRNDLRVVHENANRLLGLVNQLLDLSKLESSNMKLQTVPQNITPLLKSLVVSFTSHAERKRIALTFHSEVDEIRAYIDKEKIEKIITNILSNALKFTPEGGRIEVEAAKDGEYLNVRISDTGIGIPADKILKIFNRFYQVDRSHTREQEGTGIGLSLTKELVELHKGKIEVESTEGKGTTFVIRIPLGKEHLKPEEICEPEKDEQKADLASGQVSFGPEEMMYHEEPKKGKPEIGVITGTDLSVDPSRRRLAEADEAEKPLLLIVEDNADVRNYIKKNVKKDYRILEAIDGEDGWTKSIEQLPDIIVSDVMMPRMDGFTLCDKLKTDERTSHIPVILLTAKASSQDKIEGFATGADDYIMKPFEPEEVEARIENLIEQRKRIHEHFRKHGLFEIEEEKITPVDQKFLQRTVSMITKQMSDAGFGVEELAAEMAVSRSVLLKKIEALVGEPPSELIKRTRLNKAAKLIEGKFGNISEIALEVGFNNPSYFAECFKKQFGCSPSQYYRSAAQE
jgi:signal transduction histidine kinase/DNA-binding response OmpR family regulator